ncbi:hypothetical protein NYR90_13415 [Clostridioides difficile]|nr:hypothetical protein NYR90_13415 [Clostridioides difficile]
MNISISDIEKWEYPVVAARLSESIPESEKEYLLQIVREYLK